MIKRFNSYATKIGRRLHVTKADLFSRTRKQDVSDARHILFWLCKESGMTIAYIQKYCKVNRLDVTHPAIIHGINQVDSMMNEDMEDLIKTFNV